MKNKLKQELIEELQKALVLIRKSPKNWSDHFISSNSFYEAMKDAIKRLKANDDSKIASLVSWFMPTYDWDDFVGDLELGNKIFKLLIQYNTVINIPKTDNHNNNVNQTPEDEIK